MKSHKAPRAFLGKFSLSSWCLGAFVVQRKQPSKADFE